MSKSYLEYRRDLKNGKKDSGNSEKSDNSEKGKTTKEETGEDQPHKQKKGKTTKKPIAKVSKKRGKEMREYKPVRKKFLIDNPRCGLKLPGCTGAATEVHHQSGREGKRLLEVTDFIGACHSCHKIATKDSREAIAAGHSKTRLGKPQKG